MAVRSNNQLLFLSFWSVSERDVDGRQDSHSKIHSPYCILPEDTSPRSLESHEVVDHVDILDDRMLHSHFQIHWQFLVDLLIRRFRRSIGRRCDVVGPGMRVWMGRRVMNLVPAY